MMSRLFLTSISFLLLVLGKVDGIIAQKASEKKYELTVLADDLFNRGIPYLNAGQDDSASYCFKESLRLYHKVKNREGVLSSGIYLGIALKNTHQLASLLVYEKELESYMNESDSLFTHIKLTLGTAQYAAGNYLAALRYLKRSENSYKDQGSENEALLMQIYKNYAKIYQRLSVPREELTQYQRIFDLYNEVYDLSKFDPTFLSITDRIQLQLNQASAYSRMYKQTLALESVNTAVDLLSMNEKNLDTEFSYSFREQIGILFMDLGQLSMAETHFITNLSALSTKDSRYPEGLFHLSKLAFKQGKYSLFQDNLKFLLKSWESTPVQNEELLAESYFLQGESFRLQSQNLKSLESYQKALSYWIKGYDGKSIFKLPDLGDLPLSHEVYKCLWSYAFSFKQYAAQEKTKTLSYLEHSLSAYQRAMDLGELIQQNPLMEEEELLTIDSLNKRYEAAIQVAIQLFESHNDDRFAGIAFQFQQRKKAAEMRELVWGHFRKQGYPWAKEDELIRKDFLYRIAEGREKLKQKEGENALTSESELDRIVEDFQSFKNSLAYAHKNYFSLKSKKDYTDIAELREYLQPSEALVSYFQGAEQVYIFELRKESIALHIWENSYPIHKEIQAFLLQLKNPESSVASYVPEAFKLYKKLLEPCLQDTTSSLILVPDGILNKIPFEALVSKDSLKKQFSELDFLIKQFPIRYVQHSADLGKTQGNASYHSSQNRYAVFFPSYQSSSSSQWYKALNIDNQELETISKSFFTSLEDQREVAEKRISQMKGDSFIGKAMSKINFERYGPQYTSADIMGYALSTDHQPMYSGLTFSDHKEKQANFLSSHEILQKRFRNDLIILPNHQSIGQEINGRGMKAMIGAFQLAKCRNIAISLWQLKGSSTQELLGHFYRNLYTGVGKARSLQEAKHTFLVEKGQQQHPYYWSSLVLYGDNIELEGEDRPWWSYGALFFALFMVLLILFGFRRKRR